MTYDEYISTEVLFLVVRDEALATNTINGNIQLTALAAWTRVKTDAEIDSGSMFLVSYRSL